MINSTILSLLALITSQLLAIKNLSKKWKQRLPYLRTTIKSDVEPTHTWRSLTRAENRGSQIKEKRAESISENSYLIHGEDKPLAWNLGLQSNSFYSWAVFDIQDCSSDRLCLWEMYLQVAYLIVSGTPVTASTNAAVVSRILFSFRGSSDGFIWNISSPHSQWTASITTLKIPTNANV